MTTNEQLELFMNDMLENAYSDFKATEESKLLDEKLDKMNLDCESAFNKNEQYLVEKCFDVILDTCCHEKTYVYRRAFKDCVIILKHLGVLA